MTQTEKMQTENVYIEKESATVYDSRIMRSEKSIYKIEESGSDGKQGTRLDTIFR